jgi:ABC-type nitrate/sulfonate/bicarbonate transport system substrate-binding protein
MTAQDAALAASGAAAALAVAAAAADWARNRRRHLDRVGWMPWQLISVLSFFAALGLAALALNI